MAELSYWQRRTIADMDAMQDAATERLKTIRKATDLAKKDLQTEVDKIVGRYAKRFNLTREQAITYLNSPFDEDSRAYGFRMTRAQALSKAAKEQATKLAQIEVGVVKSQREYATKAAYRRVGKALEQQTGIPFATPDTNSLMKSINTRWTGANYSERIWKHRDTLAKTIEKEVTAACLSGKSNRKISESIAERFEVSYSRAETLVRTETSYVRNSAALQAVLDARLEEYEILTSREGCCKVCEERAKIIYRVADAMAGKTLPPFHPRCRCSIIAVIPDELWADEYDETLAHEPQTTQMVADIAKECGMTTAGLEHRIKSRESYNTKVESRGGATNDISDLLRYTLTSAPSELSENITTCIDLFSAKGYNTIRIKNTWGSKVNPYRGINTILQSPEGLKFEVQYHTPESFNLKNGRMHEIYEKQRVLPHESTEWRALNAEMFRLADNLTIPNDIERVENKP